MTIWSSLTSWFEGDRQDRENAEKNRDALVKATGAAIGELNAFYAELREVVQAFSQKHILFGDRYMRLRFRLTAIRLPVDYRVRCAQLKMDSDLYFGRARDVAGQAEKFHDFVLEHNYDTLIRFLGYDNSVRKLMNTLDEVHLRQLVTLVSGGNEAGGSPLGVNMLIHDFDNVGQAFAGMTSDFQQLKSDLAGLKLRKPLQ